MKSTEIFCTSYILIRNGKVIRNGEELIYQPKLSGTEFLKVCYNKTEAVYPKFFKMDNLSKLAWLGAELLVKDTGFSEKNAPEKKGVFLQNSSSSMDTDLKHAESIASADHYFPSPAVFVYTLPNITIGEICIRQQIKGSSAFFIFEAFEVDFLLEQVKIHMNSNRTDACITGITEWFGNQYECCLFMIEKLSDNKKRLPVSAEFMKTIYMQY